MDIEQFIQDDDFEGKHEDLDNDIKANYAPLTENNILNLGPHVLSHIVHHSENRLLRQYYDSIVEATRILRMDETLRKMMIDGWKSGFKPVRLYKPLRPVPCPEESTLVDRGWGTRFVGGAAVALWQHICYFYSPMLGAGSPSIATSSSSHDPPDPDERQYYAQYCAVLQSSGMGKSRAVDEMSKEHYVIPVVLREPQSTGHPPSDLLALNYLTGDSDKKGAFIRSCCFLHGLFCEAAAVVRGFGDSATALSLRDYMSKGMAFGSHGENRIQFYQKVIDSAEGQTSTYLSYFHSSNDPSSSTADSLLQDVKFPLHEAFLELREAIQSRDRTAPPPQKRSRTSSKPQPLVVVAFDEIHSLVTKTTDHWSYFGELRRAIRGLRREPFFALFLSTSGAAFDVTPAPTRDVSARMVHEGNVMLPFCELGFDQLVEPLDFTKQVTLSQVTSLDHLALYGRPLWKSYLPDKIIEFAAYKLLGGDPKTFQPSSVEQQLACLAQRIPIEFLSKAYTSQISSNQEKEQVHSHLRVLLKVEDTLETIVTTSPSEPTLSEAAYFLMTSRPFNPAQAMQSILDGFAVNKGELGELLVALLFIIARDKAVGPADHLGRPLGSRWCPLPLFLSCLFCPPPDAPGHPVVNVQTSFGWRFSESNVEPDHSTLADKFKNSRVYFTHFIKAQDQRVVRVEYLMRLMARGAALLCAANQAAVDGIIPFLFEGDEIKRDNIGVIMFQCKNDKSYSANPKEKFVHVMDPRVICDLADVPVIRVFFALAAASPALCLVSHKGSSVWKSYTAYDFWVAGFSRDVLLPIQAEPDTWSSILQASTAWASTYASKLPASGNLRKAMNPGVASSEEFWVEWCNAPEDA